MFLTLLIVTQAFAEWVEISQHHYRKPMHTYSINNPFITPDRVETEVTTKSWTYNNRSISEYKWKKASKIQPHIGNPKGIQFKGSAVKTTEEFRIEDKFSKPDDDELVLRPTYKPTKPVAVSSGNDNLKGTIEKVSNIGSVKRVKLNNTPVKSPTINIKGDNKTVAKNRYEEISLNNEEKHNLYEDRKGSESKLNSRRIYINNLRNRINAERPNAFPEQQDEPLNTEANVMTETSRPDLITNTYQPKIYPPKPTGSTEDFIDVEKYEQRFQSVDNSKLLGVTEKKEIFTTPANHVDKTTVTTIKKDLQKHLTKQNYKSYDSKMSSDKANDLIESQPINKVTQMNQNKNRNVNNIDNYRRTHKKENKSEAERHPNLTNEMEDETLVQQHKNKITETQEAENDNTLKGSKPVNKMSNMENLLKIMKVVADTISHNTRRTLNGKTRYLHDLKDSILSSIAERIDATWPDDDVAASHRRSRSAQAVPRGHHVQFPSSESALMTISFLTFAVFLIKLVLQIIQTYKNKAMMVAPVMVSATGRTVLSNHGHH